MTRDEEDLAPGKIVAAKYRILRKLGEGGMGMVFEAEDLRLMRRVALKFLSYHLTKDSEIKLRFTREAQAASKLDHQNICTIHEIDEDESGRLFIVMAFCQGRSLKQLIESGPLPVSQATDLAIQIAKGLARAHDAGVIHRDIKPANIMVAENGAARIVDFGLAKTTEGSAITQTAALIGTAGYMSPEQIEEEPLDFRTDLWSLGVVIYEMLTGSPPFRSESFRSTLHAVLYRSPVPPSDMRPNIPEDIEMIVLKCLSKTRTARYPSAQSLLLDLLKFRRAWDARAGGTSEAPQARPEAPAETERRHATVMYVEISGIADMLERLGPQQAGSVLQRSRTLLETISGTYEGRIEKFTDFSYRLDFGLPKAVERASAKAVRAAYELLQLFQELNRADRLDPPLRLHIGIDSGPVIAGETASGGGKAYSVMGDAVTLALKLKDASEADSIRVGPLTYRETKHEYAYRTLPPLYLKGKDAPVPVYKLLSARAPATPVRGGADRMISSSLVGREQELDKLQLHLLMALNGQGSIVNLIGEAGIGKSRLVAEFKEKSVVKNVLLLEGRSSSSGKRLSFLPIMDILRNWADIKDEDGPSDAFLKLERSVKSLVAHKTIEVFPFVATLMGMKLAGKYAERMKGLEGEALEKLILKSVRDLIEGVAAQRALVIIVEDLHWSDMSSIKLLEALYRLAEKSPILFINTLRPDYPETSQRLLDSIRYRYGPFSIEIVLPPLDNSQTAALIQNLLKTSALPAKVRELITDKAEGNPFFIEEVVRSFIDDGVVEVRDGRFLVTDKVETVHIPETVQELLMSRIDRLEEDAKGLLKVASVIGRNFFHSVILHVGADIPRIDEKLEYLKDVQLIQDRKVAGEVEHFFKHPLVQEVTYGSLLLGQRKETHLKVAEAIEAVFSQRLNEFYGMLALHYSQGGELEKTEDYLIKAGEEALRSSASNEALLFYQEALRIYLSKARDRVEPEKTAMLQRNIGAALYSRGRLIEAVEYFEKVMAFYGENNPRHILAAALKFTKGLLSFLLSIYFPAFRFKKNPTPSELKLIEVHQKRISALSVTLPLRMFIESFYFGHLITSYDLTKVENGIGMLTGYSAIFSWPGISYRLGKKILKVVKKRFVFDQAKAVLYYEFADLVYCFFTGRWDKSDQYDEGLVDRCLQVGEFFFTTNYLAFLCPLNVDRGRWGVARKLMTKVEEIGLVYEHDYAKTQKFYLRTLWLLKTRRYAEALREAAEGVFFAQQTGYTPPYFSLNAFRAKAQILLGEFEGAEKTLEELEEIKSKENVVPLYLGYYLLDRFLLDVRRLERALKAEAWGEAGAARKRSRAIGRRMSRVTRKVPYDRVEFYRWRGVRSWLLGKQKTALGWWARSIREAERLGAALELAMTFKEIGKRLSEKGSRFKELNGLSGRDYLEKAGQLLKAMDPDEEVLSSVL